MLSVTDMRGMFAITQTPSKPGSEHYDATDTVDLDEMARLLNKLIDDGVHGIITVWYYRRNGNVDSGRVARCSRVRCGGG